MPVTTRFLLFIEVKPLLIISVRNSKLLSSVLISFQNVRALKISHEKWNNSWRFVPLVVPFSKLEEFGIKTTDMPVTFLRRLIIIKVLNIHSCNFLWYRFFDVLEGCALETRQSIIFSVILTWILEFQEILHFQKAWLQCWANPKTFLKLTLNILTWPSFISWLTIFKKADRRELAF